MSLHWKMIRFFPTLALAAALLCAAPGASQTARTWTGAASADWHTPGNWSDGTVPGEGEAAVIPSGTVLLTNATAALAAFEMSGGTLAFSNWWARLDAAEVNLAGGTLRPHNAFRENEMSNRVWIVCSNLTVGPSAVIHADALGYAGVMAASGQGPGKSLVSQYRTAGAGYGGQGGNATDSFAIGAACGDVALPTAPGSSSAGRTQANNQKSGKNGGGAIRIDAAGDVTVTGTISANGAGYETYIGGAAGGGILIHCRTLQGSGTIRANGGDARQGGGEGGGGRIALHYDTAAQALLPAPPLTLSASAGKRDHHTESQFGTIHLPDASFLSESVSNIRGWLHIPGFTAWEPASLTLTNSYLGFANEAFQLTVAGSVGGTGDRMLALGTNASVAVGGDLDASVTFVSGGRCTVDGQVRIPATSWNNYQSLTAEADVTAGGDLTIQGVWRFTSAPTNGVADYGSLLAAGAGMRIVTNAQVYLYANPTNGGAALLRMDRLLITTGAVINANGGGFGGRHAAAGYGPGGGGPGATYGGGGGYGGRGGLASGGASNGWAYAPLGPGSAGGGRTASSGKAGSSGGGLVRIEACGDVTVDGTITANGADSISYCGSGAGGGIFIRAASFGGAEYAVLRANGGDRNTGGGAGGGGRIAVWTGAIDETAAGKILAGQQQTLGVRFSAADSLASFAGTSTALKGDGTADGAEDGTVFFVTVLPSPGTLLLLR